ncbi:hypothetical protein DVH24_009416 [Malus domestica]|uniref:Uncharacterized protein n=1 Tax=Malus domestica TaxID=3750 RepID=A0A498ITT7_MALDO|nr:hypothetical protein DVH24_009416 [Malus domestica]
MGKDAAEYKKVWNLLRNLASWKFPMVGLPLFMWKIHVLSAFPLERVLESGQLLHGDFIVASLREIYIARQHYSSVAQICCHLALYFNFVVRQYLEALGRLITYIYQKGTWIVCPPISVPFPCPPVLCGHG